MKKYILVINETETFVYYYKTLKEAQEYVKNHKLKSYTIALIFEDLDEA